MVAAMVAMIGSPPALHLDADWYRIAYGDLALVANDTAAEAAPEPDRPSALTLGLDLAERAARTRAWLERRRSSRGRRELAALLEDVVEPSTLLVVAGQLVRLPLTEARHEPRLTVRARVRPSPRSRRPPEQNGSAKATLQLVKMLRLDPSSVAPRLIVERATRSANYRVTYNEACYYAEIAREKEELPRSVDWYLPSSKTAFLELQARVSGPSDTDDAHGWAAFSAGWALRDALSKAPDIVAARLAQHASSDPALAGLKRRGSIIEEATARRRRSDG
jgi:hypothetical protein